MDRKKQNDQTLRYEKYLRPAIRYKIIEEFSQCQNLDSLIIQLRNDNQLFSEVSEQDIFDHCLELFIEKVEIPFQNKKNEDVEYLRYVSKEFPFFEKYYRKEQ